MNWIDAHLPMLPVLLPSLTADRAAAARRPRRRGRRPWPPQAAVGAPVWRWRRCFAGPARSPRAWWPSAADGSVRAYRVGEWPAPFGIVLVVDRLWRADAAADLAGGAAGAVVRHAAAGMRTAATSTRMFQFQLMGLNGAFVTGDLFNLFVFFEVLLIASYVLMVHGQGAVRLRVGLHYVVLNLAASALFLIGVSLLYAKTGTLNLADLALRVPELRGADATLAQSAALAAAGGVRLQGGAAAAVVVAARHLRRRQRAGGGAVRHHDQGRRVRDLARARRGVRRRGRRVGLRGGTAAAAAGAGHLRASACWARWRRTRWSAWWPGYRGLGGHGAGGGRPVHYLGLVGRRCTTWSTARWSSPACSCWPSWSRRSAAMLPTGWSRPRHWRSRRCWAC